jgi:hypothetical protein
MPLEFATANINFSNVRGTQRGTRTVSFNSPVTTAETAVQGFNFDFVSGDNNIDRAQVSTRKLRTAGNDVEVEATVIYADRLRDDDYNATVNVLVIAQTT